MDNPLTERGREYSNYQWKKEVKMKNPEEKFRKTDEADYSGLSVTEHVFCRMCDYKGKEREYRLDLIKGGNASEEKLPFIVFVHGGGFIQPCDRRQSYISLFARAFIKHGYAVISPDYPIFDDAEALKRAGGEAAGYEKAAQAVHLATVFAKENAESLNLDTGRMALAGGSAGGWASFHALARYDDGFKAFFNFWGVPTTLPDLENFPPVHSVHGSKDEIVPYEREKILGEKLEEADIPHKLVTVEGSGHTPVDKIDEYIDSVLSWLDEFVTFSSGPCR